MKTIKLFVILFLFIQGNLLAKEIKTKRTTQAVLTGIENVSDSIALENDYVRVMLNSTACSNAQTPGYGSRIIVALDDLKINGENEVKEIKRGDIAVYTADQSYEIPPGKYFEVALKAEHPPYKGPEQWLEPVKNKVVYEDKQFRVFEERLAAGDIRPLHSHAQRVVVRLNPARLTDPTKEKKNNKEGSLQVPNTVKFAEPMVHVVQNISEVALFNIIIEFKYQNNE